MAAPTLCSLTKKNGAEEIASVSDTQEGLNYEQERTEMSPSKKGNPLIPFIYSNLQIIFRIFHGSVTAATCEGQAIKGTTQPS